MSKMTKTLLVLSVVFLAVGIAFVTGLVNVGDAVALYVTLPAGAIFFGLFLISLSLQAESAFFDEEQRLSSKKINLATPTGRKPCCEPKEARKEELATAHAH